MRMVTVVGNKVLSEHEGAEMRLLWSQSLRDRGHRVERRLSRIDNLPSERRSVERAMLAVEDRIVRALWVLSRLPGERGIGYASRNGVDYVPESGDRFAAAVAAGGRWEQPAPRPSVPSGREIDAMYEPLRWLRFLDRQQARLLTAGAQAKRGDVSRNISWIRLRASMPELNGYSVPTLHRLYRGALREIVTELTIAKVGQMQ